MYRTSYDSTWEEDEDDGSAEQERSTNNVKVKKNAQAPWIARRPQNGEPLKPRYKYPYMYSSAARDMQNYRHGYRCSGSSIDSEKMLNLRFYRNEITFKPNGCHIKDFLNAGKDDYDMLEHNHNYIQWLFPLQERGVNRHATPLHEIEIQEMKKDRKVTRNLLDAYKLMLGFYGMHLKNEETGEVCRAENWKERYTNLNNHTHNNLRITRILKCLGELGFERFQAPLVQFFLDETLCQGELKNVKKGVLDYFMFSVKDKRKRQDLVRFAYKHYEPQSSFVWGPVDLLRNDQEALKGRKRENSDSIRGQRGEEDHREDERRPPKSKKENGQDGVMEHGNVETKKASRDHRELTGRLKILSLKGNCQNAVKKQKKAKPQKNKSVNREKKVTSQAITRKHSVFSSCFPFKEK